MSVIPDPAPVVPYGDSLSDYGGLSLLLSDMRRGEKLANEGAQGDSAAAPVPGVEVLGENRFLAARDGMDAQLIDTGWGGLTPAREVLGALIIECRPHVAEPGCAAALEQAHDLMPANGATRQRDFTAGAAGLENLVEHLALGFATPERAVAGTGWPTTATNAG